MELEGGLLNRIIQKRDRRAFDVVVGQYIHLVYAAARRQVGAGHADDITQAVFCLLWEKPAKVGKEAHLAGWLINATRLTAMQWQRSESRRLRREKISATQRPTFAGETVDSTSDELSPVLDSALADLSDAERTAIVLRYLQDRSVDEVARIIGITPAAAMKRLSRGLDQLRRRLGSRGRAMDAQSLASAMVVLGHQSPTPSENLVDRIVQHAMAKPAAPPATLHAVLRGLLIPKASAVAAGLLIIATVIGGFTILRRGAGGALFAQDSSASPVASPATQPQSPSPIKVGVTLSKFTAITASPSGKPWGYGKQTRIVRDIDAPDVQIIPVIEPGTQDDPALRAQLDKIFPGKTPIDGSDPAALKQLDVLVAHEDWMVPPEELKAFDQAVSQGLPLLNIGGLGWATPGLHGNNPSPGRLTGMSEVQGGYTNSAIDCNVISSHEILGGLQADAPLQLRPLGMYGILPPDATPLIEAVDSTQLIPRGPHGDPAKYVCYPLYISHLEKGTIIGIAFSPYAAGDYPNPAELLRRSVHLLAHRPYVTAAP